MPFLSLCPILPCLDIAATRQLYETIGFTVQGVWDDYGYMILTAGGAELHFTEMPELDPWANTSGGYLRLDDVDGLSDRIAGLGWPVDAVSIPRFGPAVDTPWGMRETSWIDPSGNLIRAGRDITSA